MSSRANKKAAEEEEKLLKLFQTVNKSQQDGFTQWCEQSLHTLNTANNLDGERTPAGGGGRAVVGWCECVLISGSFGGTRLVSLEGVTVLKRMELPCVCFPIGSL